MSLNLLFMILFHTYYHWECMYKIGNTYHNFWKKIQAHEVEKSLVLSAPFCASFYHFSENIYVTISKNNC